MRWISINSLHTPLPFLLCLSVKMCIVAVKYDVGTERNSAVVFLEGDFLFTSSDTFAVVQGEKADGAGSGADFTSKLQISKYS